MKKKIIIIVVSICILILITVFAIDMNRMKNNKSVLFSTWGISYEPSVNLEEIENIIKNYLASKGNNEYEHHENEKDFYSMKIYLAEEKEDICNIYAWVVEERYYLENNEIKQAGGSSIPYKFVIKRINGKFTVSDSVMPRDGDYYAEDMKNIFPNSVINDMDGFYADGTMESLQADIQQQTELYFHK